MKRLLNIAMIMLTFFSCEPIDDIDSYEVLQERKKVQKEEQTPTVVVKTLTVSPYSFNIEAAGGSLTTQIKSNCDWRASRNVAWCHLSATSGSGDASLVMTVDENTSEESRTAMVTITYDSKTAYVIITQKGKENVQRDPSGDDNTPPSW